jgi:hypothetical protein
VGCAELKAAISAFLDTQDRLAARLACTHCRYPFAMHVKRLYARNGDLCPRAFEVFPSATGLGLFFDCTLTKQELDERMMLLGAALREDLELLDVSFAEQQPQDRPFSWSDHMACLDTFFQYALPSLPCCKTLKTVHVSDIGNIGAQHLLNELTSATDIELRVWWVTYSDLCISSLVPHHAGELQD